MNSIFKKDSRVSYIIQDWAGNVCFNEKQFNTFHDAWECVYQHYKDEEINNPNTDPHQEYYVEVNNEKF